MTERLESSAMPQNVRARERLRDAQAAEARAVGAICTAESTLVRVRAKRDRVVAAADATVVAAEREVAHRHGLLVSLTGLEHAATLLGTTPAKLRRATSAARRASGGVE